jgi:hypothetical protein
MSCRRSSSCRKRIFMKAFTLAANDISIFNTSKQQKDRCGPQAQTFCTRDELGALAEKLPSARLIEIWNGLPGVRPVRRFTSRAVAVGRIWNAIQHLHPPIHPQVRAGVSKSVRAKTSGAAASPAVRPTSKAALVIDLLRDSKGATLQHITDATGWQAHTVRGFISGHLKMKLGLRVRSFKRDGERVYSIKA